MIYLWGMEKVYVYLHRRKDTGEVFYVGIGTKRRPYDKGSRNQLWKDVEKNHGRTVHIIYEFPTIQQAQIVEIMLIEKYGRINNNNGCLTNLTRGGEGFNGINVIGEKNPFYGKKHTKETLEKISKTSRERALGRPLKESTKEKLRQYRLGTTHSEETKRKMRETRKGTNQGVNNPMYGKISNMRGSNSPNTNLVKEQVLQIRKLCEEGNYTTYKIADMFNISQSSVMNIKKRRTWKHI